jgi:bifunctional non-homologous end joining protein LigD
MRLRLVKEPFDNSDYIFELKHDGFRALAYLDAGECRLVSRNLKSLLPRLVSVQSDATEIVAFSVSMPN